jgi:hypothetical protein
MGRRKFQIKLEFVGNRYDITKYKKDKKSGSLLLVKFFLWGYGLRRVRVLGRGIFRSGFDRQVGLAIRNVGHLLSTQHILRGIYANSTTIHQNHSRGRGIR